MDNVILVGLHSLNLLIGYGLNLTAMLKMKDFIMRSKTIIIKVENMHMLKLVFFSVHFLKEHDILTVRVILIHQSNVCPSLWPLSFRKRLN